ncbi:MAG: hypothetical protein J0H91_17235 [Rhodospirillales bacterium]|nr:hypothetical protein [Rhodospirillales bacterium]
MQQFVAYPVAMPIPSELPDLALPPESSPVNRRLSSQHVREARDRLTSTSGTRPAFDYELVRLYAQNRMSASLIILLLIGTIGFLSSLWTGVVSAGAWMASVLVIHAVIITKCRQFLAAPNGAAEMRAWRLRFIMLDLFYGLAWMFILIHPVGVDESSGTFMLFVMLLVVAVSSMLASNLPMAVYAATFPVTAAVALDFSAKGRALCSPSSKSRSSCWTSATSSRAATACARSWLARRPKSDKGRWLIGLSRSVSADKATAASGIAGSPARRHGMTVPPLPH